MEHFIQQLPVIPKDELEKFMEMLRDEITEWNGATINHPSVSFDKMYRDTDVYHLTEGSSTATLMHHYLNEGCRTYGNNLREKYGEEAMIPPIMTAQGTFSHRQGMQILRYRPGQFYNYHIDKDYAGVSEESSRRTLSIVLYLTDDHQGGGTEFPGKVYKPKAGEALIFPAEWSYPHKAQPVLKGEKWVCVTWYEVYGS